MQIRHANTWISCLAISILLEGCGIFGWNVAHWYNGYYVGEEAMESVRKKLRDARAHYDSQTPEWREAFEKNRVYCREFTNRPENLDTKGYPRGYEECMRNRGTRVFGDKLRADPAAAAALDATRKEREAYYDSQTPEWMKAFRQNKESCWGVARSFQYQVRKEGQPCDKFNESLYNKCMRDKGTRFFGDNLPAEVWVLPESFVPFRRIRINGTDFIEFDFKGYCLI